MSNVNCQQVCVQGDNDGLKYACMWRNKCGTEERIKYFMSHRNTMLMYLLAKFTEFFFILNSISALNHRYGGGVNLTSSELRRSACIHNIFLCVKDFPIVLQPCAVVQSCMYGSLAVRYCFCYSFLNNVH